MIVVKIGCKVVLPFSMSNECLVVRTLCTWEESV